MTFPEFVAKWRDGTIHENATWRAYSVETHVKPRHIAKALKALGLSYAGDLAMPQFMHLYGLRDRREAEVLVGSWWLMEQVRFGGRMAGTIPKRVAVADLFPDPTCPRPSPDPRTTSAT